MRVFFSNLGCKLNQAEVERLKRQFVDGGHELASSLVHADLHVVNSCTVTHVAARDSRKIVRRGRRLNPALKTVLTGCHVNASPDEAAGIAEVDLVVPNEHKDDLLARVREAFPRSVRPLTSAPQNGVPYMPMHLVNTRTLVKIEDGCNMHCAFCVIPHTRGRQRSRTHDQVVDEVRSLAAAGFQEVVLTGVQISSYRWQGRGLFELVEAVLGRTGIPRLRLTSIAPWKFDQRLLDIFASGRLCRHFHLSLQSGSDATLKRMRRPYTSDAFADLVGMIRARVPAIAITTDIIVGFPGETEDEFRDSLDFTERMQFARVHAFPYSSRPHTEAATLSDHVAHHTKRERMKRMLLAGERAERAFWGEQLGTEVEILWERPWRGHWLGMTDNYIRVQTPVPQQTNRLASARLERIREHGVEVADPHSRARLGNSSPPRPSTPSLHP